VSYGATNVWVNIYVHMRRRKCRPAEVWRLPLLYTKRPTSATWAYPTLEEGVEEEVEDEGGGGRRRRKEEEEGGGLKH